MLPYEQLLKKYTYKDNKLKGQILFEYITYSIEVADNAYQEKYGIDVKQQKHVGISVEIIEE